MDFTITNWRVLNIRWNLKLQNIWNYCAERFFDAVIFPSGWKVEWFLFQMFHQNWNKKFYSNLGQNHGIFFWKRASFPWCKASFINMEPKQNVRCYTCSCLLLFSCIHSLPNLWSKNFWWSNILPSYHNQHWWLHDCNGL